MAQMSREESLRIINDFINQKGTANNAVPASAQQPQQSQPTQGSREENLKIINDFISGYTPKNQTVENSSFTSKSGKFGQADSAQAKTDTRSSERAALEAQLNELNNLGFNATAKQQAEAQAKRAQIEKRLKEIDESSKPNKDTSGLNAAQTKRFNELQEELASIKLPSFIPAGGKARELANRREEILAELDELDKAAGRDARSYDGLSRRTNWLKSWLNRTGASYTNAVGNMAELINREDKPIQGRGYEAENEKFADFIGRFDPKSADALRQNVPQANKNISDSFRGFSDNAYKAADTMLERSEGQLAKAKYGVSGAKSIAMDAGSTLLDIGVDRLGAAALGVPGLANMFARVYGSTAQDARLRGDDVETASLKGLKAATIEVVTEKIGGAFEGAYGKSLTSEALNAVRKKFGNVMNRLERSGVLRWVLDTVGEGGEEALADILNTTVDHMVGWDDGSMTTIEDILSQKDDILYDTFLGSLVGSLGASTNLINNRANARANAQNSAPAQTAQEAQNVQRDIPAAPKTENMRTADSGALNAALETIGAVTRAGGSTESAMKLLSPKQIEAYNNYRAERNAAEEAANKPAESENANAAGDELAALNKALKGYDEQTRNDIIEEYRKVVEGKAPTSFEARVSREAIRTMREAEAREKGIEVFKPTYDEDALDIAEKRVAARKEAKYQDKRKSVATAENSEYDDTRFEFDYDAARKKAEKAYALELKRWYEEHPNESEPDPDSWLSDRSAYISEYVRRLSRIEFAEHKKANELISKAQFRDRNLGKTGETHQETRQDDYRRDDEAYKDNVDEDWDTNSRRTDISGNKVDVYGTRSISRGTFRSDAEAPPVTAAERRYAKLIGKERADSIEKREAARAAVTENATERMERMAAENKLLRKVVEAKTKEERASAQEEYKKFKDNEAANLATKNGGEDDVHRIRYDEVRGRPGLESGDRGNIENVRRDADSRELGRLSEVVRHAGPAEREQRLEEAGYKTIPEREYSSEEVKANKVIRNLVGDDANVVILAGEGRDSGLAHTESDGRRTIFLVRKPNPRYRMEDVAAHEAAHIRMPEGIKSNAHQYAKYLLLNNGFT